MIKFKKLKCIFNKYLVVINKQIDAKNYLIQIGF